MTIKVLKKQGKSIKGIARETGLARNTVKKYLQQAQAIPNARKPSVRPSKLDPFKPYLQTRIHNAAPDWIPAAVLYAEIGELGYERARFASSVSTFVNSSLYRKQTHWCGLKPIQGNKCRWISPPLSEANARLRPL